MIKKETRLKVQQVFAVLAGLTFASCAAFAQQWPTKPVQIVVPGNPGGANDTLARIYITELTKRWNQPITVDNRPGAAGLLAAEVQTRAPADGYTLLLHADAVMSYASTLKTRFDAEKELIPIHNMAITRQICLTNPESGLKSWTSLVGWAKTNPGKLNASHYPNTVHHLQMHRMMQMAGIQATLVPYNGQPQSMRAVLSNEIHLACVSPQGVAEQVKGGKVVALVVTSSDRAKFLPDVPTLKESGLDFEWYQWFGLFASVGTPKNVVTKITADVGAVSKLPDVQEKIRAAGLDPETRSPKESAAMITASAQQYKKAAQEAGIKPQ